MRFDEYILCMRLNSSVEGISKKDYSSILRGLKPHEHCTSPALGCIVIKSDSPSKFTNKVIRCAGEYYTNLPTHKKINTIHTVGTGSRCYDIKEALGIPNYISTCAECHRYCLEKTEESNNSIFRVFNNKNKNKKGNKKNDKS